MAHYRRTWLRFPSRHVSRRRESVRAGHSTHGANNEEKQRVVGGVSANHTAVGSLRRIRELSDCSQERKRCAIHRRTQRRAHFVPRKPADGRRNVGLSRHVRLRCRQQHRQPCNRYQLVYGERRCNDRCCAFRRRYGQHTAWRIDKRHAALP